MHQVPGDGALGHRQAAVFSVVGTSQSWGRVREKKVGSGYRDPEEGRPQL